MGNIVYYDGEYRGYCYVAKIFYNKLEITRHLKAGGLAPWGNTFRKSLALHEDITALNALREFAKGDAA